MENFDNEQWRDIDGYEGVYQVSDFGRVRSLKYGKVRVLIPRKDNDGYLQVALCKDGKIKKCRVHRLVAQAFIENDDETKIYINHRDECKQNNIVSNLEYCTAQYNSTYNDIHHRRNTKRCKLKDLYRPDLTYKQNLELFKEQGVKCSIATFYRLRKDITK